MDLPKLKPGQHPSAAEWNAVVERLESLNFAGGQPTGEISLSRGLGGIQVNDARERKHWAKITGTDGSGNYSHEAVAPVSDGTWVSLGTGSAAMGPWGTTTPTLAAPAREVMNRTDVPTDSIVEMWPDNTIPGFRFGAVGSSGAGTDCCPPSSGTQPIPCEDSNPHAPCIYFGNGLANEATSYCPEGPDTEDALCCGDERYKPLCCERGNPPTCPTGEAQTICGAGDTDFVHIPCVGGGTGYSFYGTMTLTMTGSGSFGGLSANVDSSFPANGYGWPVAYTSPDGKITISGRIVYCCVADQFGFVGMIISTATGAEPYPCGCIQNFNGCETGTDPGEVTQDTTAGAVSLTLHSGCGTVILSMGPVIPPVSFNCVGGTCVDPGDGTGTFATSAACIESGCAPPPQCCESDPTNPLLDAAFVSVEIPNGPNFGDLVGTWSIGTVGSTHAHASLDLSDYLAGPDWPASVQAAWLVCVDGDFEFWTWADAGDEGTEPPDGAYTAAFLGCNSLPYAGLFNFGGLFGNTGTNGIKW